MALSNIFREPRREITESVVGVGACGAFIGIDIIFAYWFANQVYSHGDSYAADVAVGFFVGLLLAFAMAMGAVFTHWIGEEICETVKDRGLDPRPKRRY